MPVPLTLTPGDDGRVFAMTVGQTTDLVVPDPLAPEPTLEGNGIELIAIVNVAPSGRREWELRAIGAGRTTITGDGKQPFVITIDVTDP